MIDINDKVILWIDSFEIPYKKKEGLLSLYDDKKFILEDIRQKNQNVVKILGNNFNLLFENLQTFDNVFGVYAKHNVKIITYINPHYPERLKNIDNPPFVLYCIGDINLLNSQSIGIVGSRKVTNYGRIVTEKFATALAKAGLTVISGLAHGVDSIAHQSTLDVNGKTIAVLGGGFANIYPAENYGLALKIAKTGLLVTEYSYYQNNDAFHFPLRNRIIAGLSDGVLITEASEQSGTMHTKNYAIDYGKELYLVPGNITSSSSGGCNNAIKNLQGAVVLSPQDILDNYNTQLKMEDKKIELTSDEKLIINIIGDEELPFQVIALKSKLDINKLNSLLIAMQLKGIIKKVAGNCYRK